MDKIAVHHNFYHPSHPQYFVSAELIVWSYSWMSGHLAQEHKTMTLVRAWTWTNIPKLELKEKIQKPTILCLLFNFFRKKKPILLNKVRVQDCLVIHLIHLKLSTHKKKVTEYYLDIKQVCGGHQNRISFIFIHDNHLVLGGSKNTPMKFMSNSKIYWANNPSINKHALPIWRCC